MFTPDTKILIIDDFATMRKIVKKVLAELQFTNITEADDGATAWPMLEQAQGSGQPFQLVISDWNMPNMKGIDLLRNVRKHPQMGKMPFIMVTAETEQQNILEAIQAGVSDYIVKPFNGATLKTKLENAYKKTAGAAKAA
jgi:two-component system chemotaxis response regulator CheY